MGLKHLIQLGIPKNLARLLMGEKEIKTLEEAVWVYEHSGGKLKKKALEFVKNL